MDAKKIAGFVLSVVVSVGGYLAYRHFTSRGSAPDIGLSSDHEANKPTGSFKATGGTIGKWDMAVTACASGEKNHFDGVILYDKADKTRHVRFVKARGNTYDVLVQQPGSEDAIIVPKCKVEVAIAKTGTNVNFHDEIQGTAKLTCPTLTGSATFPSCY